MTWQTIIILTIGILTGGIALLVLSKNSKNIINRTFFISMFSFGCWMSIIASLWTIRGKESFWLLFLLSQPFVYIGSAFYYYLALHFPQRKEPVKFYNKLLVAIYIVAALILLITKNDLRKHLFF